MDSYDFERFRRAAHQLSQEHRAAVATSEEAGKELARAEATYHRELAVAVGYLKPQGATVAETLAKGEPKVTEAKEARDVAAARDRAAMERIRLCRDDRAVLLTMGAWSKMIDGFDEG